MINQRSLRNLKFLSEREREAATDGQSAAPTRVIAVPPALAARPAAAHGCGRRRDPPMPPLPDSDGAGRGAGMAPRPADRSAGITISHIVADAVLVRHGGPSDLPVVRGRRARRTVHLGD